MIKNFPELQFVVERCEKRIQNIQKDINHFMYCQNFKKVKELLCQKRFHELKMQDYISNYKEKLTTNYLENKIFANKLKDLENRCQQKSIIEEVVYCVTILQLEHIHFESKSRYFINRVPGKNYSLCIKKINEIEDKVQNIFNQGKLLSDISQIEVSKKLREEYNSLLIYFELNDKNKKLNLEIKLKEQKRQLLINLVKFKLTLAYVTSKEIEKIRRELKIINNRLLNKQNKYGKFS